ncbi:MAG: cytochrome c [bacterium]
MKKAWPVVFGVGAAALVAVLLLFQDGFRGPDLSGSPPEEIFRVTCAACHGLRGEGILNKGAALRGMGIPAEKVKAMVRNGKNMMPAQPHIKGEALERLAKYVEGLR